MHSWSKNNLVLEAHSLWQTHANSCIFLLLSKVSSSKMEARPWTSKVTLNLKPVFKKLWSNMINMSQHFSIILKLFWDGVNQANCFISFRTRTRTCCTRISMYHWSIHTFVHTCRIHYLKACFAVVAAKNGPPTETMLRRDAIHPARQIIQIFLRHGEKLLEVSGELRWHTKTPPQHALCRRPSQVHIYIYMYVFLHNYIHISIYI
jgi:hypothetical protein